MPASKNRREQGELQGAAQRVTRHTMMGRRTRKGQAVRFLSLKRRPLRSGVSEHATQQITRAAGYWRPDAV